MKAGKNAVEANRKNLDIEEMENIKDDIADQLADAEEINNFFSEAAGEGAEELMDELDEILAQDAMENMVDAGSGIVPISGNKVN
jgi:hypothetical protein